MSVTQAELKALLKYNPETGLFTRLKTTSHNAKAGDIAGGLVDGGYQAIWINGKRHFAHRLAFLYMEGYFPEHQVDHINGICNDNRWDNLRHIAKSCNMQNSKVSKNNTSGYKGVYLDKRSGKYRSSIMINNKMFRLGCHGTALDAALARIAAEDCHPDYHCDVRCENRVKVFADLKRSISNSKRDSM